MTPAKEREHEPTAVKRDPSDQRIVEPRQTGTNPKEAKETPGAAETGEQSEQGGAAGTNQ